MSHFVTNVYNIVHYSLLYLQYHMHDSLREGGGRGRREEGERKEGERKERERGRTSASLIRKTMVYFHVHLSCE